MNKKNKTCGNCDYGDFLDSDKTGGAIYQCLIDNKIYKRNNCKHFEQRLGRSKTERMDKIKELKEKRKFYKKWYFNLILGFIVGVATPQITSKINFVLRKGEITSTINREIDNYTNIIRKDLIKTEKHYDNIKNEFAHKGTLNSSAYFQKKKEYIEKIESDYKEWLNNLDIELSNKYLIQYNIKLDSLESYGNYTIVKESTELLVEKLKINFDEELKQANISKMYIKPFKEQDELNEEKGK